MENFATENYMVEVVQGGHRVVDKCQRKATPVDRSGDNYLILKESFETKQVIFNSICEELIKSTGRNYD